MQAVAAALLLIVKQYFRLARFGVRRETMSDQSILPVQRTDWLSREGSIHLRTKDRIEIDCSALGFKLPQARKVVRRTGKPANGVNSKHIDQ